MAQMSKVRGTATKVTHGAGNDVSVRYHQTEVARREGSRVTLNSGGWQTNTTKTRMVQFSREFCDGIFGVYQDKGQWFVSFCDGRTPEKCEFFDGMSFHL
jgi:exopolysaccharide biosynthesis protein